MIQLFQMSYLTDTTLKWQLQRKDFTFSFHIFSSLKKMITCCASLTVGTKRQGKEARIRIEDVQSDK